MAWCKMAGVGMARGTVLRVQIVVTMGCTQEDVFLLAQFQ